MNSAVLAANARMHKKMMQRRKQKQLYEMIGSIGFAVTRSQSDTSESENNKRTNIDKK